MEESYSASIKRSKTTRLSYKTSNLNVNKRT